MEGVKQHCVVVTGRLRFIRGVFGAPNDAFRTAQGETEVKAQGYELVWWLASLTLLQRENFGVDFTSQFSHSWNCGASNDGL